eukprot:2037106-Rhodomonas_salina.2
MAEQPRIAVGLCHARYLPMRCLRDGRYCPSAPESILAMFGVATMRMIRNSSVLVPHMPSQGRVAPRTCGAASRRNMVEHML